MYLLLLAHLLQACLVQNCSWSQNRHAFPSFQLQWIHGVANFRPGKYQVCAEDVWWAAGVDEPIFASAVPAVQQTQLRNVLKEVVDAYAQNIDSNRSNMDPSSLRDLLKQKVAARKAR